MSWRCYFGHCNHQTDPTIDPKRPYCQRATELLARRVCCRCQRVRYGPETSLWPLICKDEKYAYLEKW